MLVIAGFLFLIEAVSDLLVHWYVACTVEKAAIVVFLCLYRARYCALKALQLTGKTRTIIHLLRHVVFVGVSVIGIIGAVKQSNDVSNGDIAGSTSAKRLRQASGALFLLVIALFFVVTFYLLVSSADLDGRKPRKAPTASVIIISLVALAVEAVYRIWSASSTTGFIIKQTALDVLVVMPEWVVLVLSVALNMDDMTDIRLVGQSRPAPHMGQLELGCKCVQSF